MTSRSLTVLLFASLVANALLLVTLFLVWQPDRPMNVQVVRPPMVTNVFSPIRTNIVVQARRLRWSDLESTNYDRYITNLRGIGCPESTIRDIIVAEIDEIFAVRWAREVITPGQQWWRAEPDPAIVEAARQAKAALATERNTLLTRLLGEHWQDTATETLFARQERPLDGPVLGTLSDETRQRVREIERRAALGIPSAPASGTNLPPSPVPAEATSSDAVLRAALATVLTPEQLEEYLLRYSDTAKNLRRQTADFSPSPEEFRALFQAAGSYDQQLAALAKDTSADADKQRVEILVQREAALLDTLPEERRNLYTLAQTPEYHAARQTAEALDLPDEKVVPLSQIQQLVAEERTRILNDSELDEDAQAARLAEVEDQRRQALEKVLGADAFRRYQALEKP